MGVRVACKRNTENISQLYYTKASNFKKILKTKGKNNLLKKIQQKTLYKRYSNAPE